MNRKEELEKELKELQLRENEQMYENVYPEFKGYEGKFYKFKNNYSMPKKKSDYWFLYKQVTRVDRDDMYRSGDDIYCNYHGWSFETDKYGNVRVELDANGYIHSLNEYEEISREEFLLAWDRLTQKLLNIKL